MKKLLLFTVAAALSVSAMAQNMRVSGTASNSAAEMKSFGNNFAAKGTANGDTLILINHVDTFFYYTFIDTPGYIYGMNAFGYNSAAERYDFNPADSSLELLGIVSEFTGHYQASTNKMVTLKAWSQGTLTGTSPIKYNGFPNTLLDSINVSIKNLGIDPTGAHADSGKYTVLPSHVMLTDSFFVGFSMDYVYPFVGGDTIGLMSSNDGKRLTTLYTVVGPDTIYNVKSAVGSGNSWADNYRFYGLKNDLAIFPVVIIHTVTSVHGIGRNDFTYYGAYPNPATTNTNVKFALKNAASVTIELMDVTGRVVTKTAANNLSTGEHIIPVETANLTPGNYIVLVRTSAGDGIGQQITVGK
ncbi:MAG: hypothetical protein BGO69_08485 [Bacteroidetes bacterium 46-16]|nr:MAG: hypothetical protein BGO69_08485 [Bacteroidetes bacterium 46-16]